MLTDFQDDTFDVAGARADVVMALLGFADDPERPQKLLIHLRSNGWCAFFLSAYLGHWNVLSEEQRRDIHDDYEDVPLVDYGALFNLSEAMVLSISCRRSLPDGTQILLQLDRGTLTFGEVDPLDHHSENYLRWAPNTLCQVEPAVSPRC